MNFCLVISGHAERRENMREIIESLGFVVLEAANGQSASLSAHGLLPGVIVLDDDTPGIDGPEFIKQIATLKNGKRPLILYWSHGGDRSGAEQALLAGAHECLTNEPDLGILANLVNGEGRYAPLRRV